MAKRYIQRRAAAAQQVTGGYHDLDTFLFKFDTPTMKSRFPDYPLNPPGRTLPRMATESKTPDSDAPPVPFCITGVPPLWNQGNAWSVPFDAQGTGCILFYKRRYPFFKYTVPDQYLLKIQWISYELADSVPVDTVFKIYVFRDNELITEFKDMVINPNHPNPAHRYAMAGHTRQLPFLLRVDKRQQFSVFIELLGPPGSAFTENDAIVANGVVCPVGFQTRLSFDYDGAPKGHIPRMTAAQQRGTGQGLNTFEKDKVVAFLKKLRHDNKITKEQHRILEQAQMHRDAVDDGIWYPR